MIIFDKLQDF